MGVIYEYDSLGYKLTQNLDVLAVMFQYHLPDFMNVNSEWTGWEGSLMTILALLQTLLWWIPCSKGEICACEICEVAYT